MKSNHAHLFMTWLCLLPPFVLATEPTLQPELDFQETYGGDEADGVVAVVPARDGGLFVVGSSQSKPSGNRTAPLLGGISDFWWSSWMSMGISSGIVAMVMTASLQQSRCVRQCQPAKAEC